MRKRGFPIIITLAILAPGLIAGAWVGTYLSTHQHHSAPHATTLSIERQMKTAIS